MKTKHLFTATGVALAMATAGYASDASKTASNTEAATVETGHCYGVNKCKGHNDCGGKDNACGGHGSCKGSGYVVMPTKACKDIGGKVKDDWRGTANVADLKKCSDANTCGGHNDCKTASNACKGKASCKGQGFVLMSAEACEKITNKG